MEYYTASLQLDQTTFDIQIKEQDILSLKLLDFIAQLTTCCNYIISSNGIKATQGFGFENKGTEACDKCIDDHDCKST